MLFLGEEVGVDFLDFIDLFCTYAYVVVNHIIAELAAVYEDNLDVGGQGVVFGFFREAGCRDKDAFSGTLTGQCAEDMET